MIDFSPAAFMNIVKGSITPLTEYTIQSFTAHIRRHSCVSSATFANNAISVVFTEPVEISGVNVANLFMNGGRIRKTSSIGKDKVEESDFFYITPYKR